MRILLTNDDGIRAPGIRDLAEAASRFGEVKIFAPSQERSCCARVMSMRDPIRVEPVDFDGFDAFEVSGYPVDCVNLGLRLGWPDGCDLVLSGINYGPNLGYDITYSGTAGAALEGAMNGIRSIALSMAVLEAVGKPFYETGCQWLTEHWEALMAMQLPELTLLNINIPAMPYDQVLGERVVRMGRRVYAERMEKRLDPWERSYWWQGGAEILPHAEPETDFHAITERYVSITPISLDWTDRDTLKSLQNTFAKSGVLVEQR